MQYRYFSHNGVVEPIETAVIPLQNVEYSYGFGVYETIRVTKRTALFLDDHLQRLLQSATTIGLDHFFKIDSIALNVSHLLEANEVDTCNIKIILIGGATAQNAKLYMLCLNPLFPDRSLYKTGVTAITQHYERPFPQAKSLNMLPSYLAFRAAKQAKAYDALLINKKDELVEGTRTNLLARKGQTIISPPAEQILLGVTRDKVLMVAAKAGYAIVEQPIRLGDVLADGFDDLFITSTSSKIMPIASLDGHTLGAPSSHLAALMRLFNEFLAQQIS